MSVDGRDESLGERRHGGRRAAVAAGAEPGRAGPGTPAGSPRRHVPAEGPPRPEGGVPPPAASGASRRESGVLPPPIELPPADAELIERMRSGDDTAYEELFRRHADAVRRYARTCCRDAHTADDLTAEVFARVLQAVRGGARPRARRTRLSADDRTTRRGELDQVGEARAPGRRLRGVRRAGRARLRGVRRRHPGPGRRRTGDARGRAVDGHAGVPVAAGALAGRAVAHRGRGRVAERGRHALRARRQRHACARQPGPRGPQAGVSPGPCERHAHHRRGVRALRRPARRVRPRRAAHAGRARAAQAPGGVRQVPAGRRSDQGSRQRDPRGRTGRRHRLVRCRRVREGGRAHRRRGRRGCGRGRGGRVGGGRRLRRGGRRWRGRRRGARGAREGGYRGRCRRGGRRRGGARAGRRRQPAQGPGGQAGPVSAPVVEPRVPRRRRSPRRRSPRRTRRCRSCAPSPRPRRAPPRSRRPTPTPTPTPTPPPKPTPTPTHTDTDPEAAPSRRRRPAVFQWNELDVRRHRRRHQARDAARREQLGLAAVRHVDRRHVGTRTVSPSTAPPRSPSISTARVPRTTRWSVSTT